MISELECPEKLESPYFKIQSTLEPHNLVEASKTILQAVNAQPMLTYSYCLEVEFENDIALFTLCLNPVLWFDLYLRNKGLDVSAKIARTYVTNTRITVPYENDKMAPFEIEYRETINNSAFKYCRYGKNCKKKFCDKFLFADPIYLKYQYSHGVSHRYIDSLTNVNNSLGRDHSVVICEGTSKTRDGRDIIWGYYVLNELVVWERQKYYIMMRREPIRGLLFVPRPNDDVKNNFNHVDNTALILSQSFWRVLLSERRYLGFNSISLNYGKWETKQASSEDKYIQNCHGHAHLNFDDAGWENIKAMVFDDLDFTLSEAQVIRQKLNARNFPEQNNRLKNCSELEHFRLQIVESQLMIESSTKLADKVDDVVTSLFKTNGVLSETNGNLAQLINLLKRKEQH